MKATGIVRKVDEIGRIVILIELRRTRGVDVMDPVEIFMESDTIVLKKHEPSCVFCGEEKDVSEYKGKMICSDCMGR